MYVRACWDMALTTIWGLGSGDLTLASLLMASDFPTEPSRLASLDHENLKGNGEI